MVLRDGSTTSDPRLDRLVDYDEASRAFGIAAVVPQAVASRSWLLPPANRLNQGQQGSCVGHGWTHELLSAPSPIRGVDHDYAVGLYYDAQRTDRWAGGEYPGASPRYSGTSNLAGAKVAKARGFIDEYRWCFSIDDVMRALSHEGPVVAATSWRSSMWETRPSGLIESVDSSDEGGHCYLLRGLTLKPSLKGESKLGPVIRITNSWGPGWGILGEAFIRVEDFEKLLHAQGDACVPMGRKKPKG